MTCAYSNYLDGMIYAYYINVISDKYLTLARLMPLQYGKWGVKTVTYFHTYFTHFSLGMEYKLHSKTYMTCISYSVTYWINTDTWDFR